MQEVRSRPRNRLRRLVLLAVALAGLLGASLASMTAAHADYTGSNLPNWAIGPFTRAPRIRC